MSPEGKYKDADLKERPLTLEAEEKLEEASKQAEKVKTMCTFADGVSLVLEGIATIFEPFSEIFKIFKPAREIVKIASNINDMVANFTRYRSYAGTLRISRQYDPSIKHSFLDHFYKVEKKTKDGVEVEMTEVISKRLVRTAASMGKMILGIAKLVPILPIAPLFQMVLEAPQYLSLFLDVVEVACNWRNFTEKGEIFTSDNIEKIASALCYHVISCVTFATSPLPGLLVLANAYGVVGFLGITLTAYLMAKAAVKLGDFFDSLVEKGMKDTALVMQPIDKLLLNNKISTVLSTDSLFPNSSNFFINGLISGKETSTFVRGLYLALLGIKLCILAVKKLKEEEKRLEKEVELVELMKEIEGEAGTKGKEKPAEVKGIAELSGSL
ncbi:MAG: hypothetical protein LBJ75_03250 [Puniceicoccales bacterium]|nr:hypothetical protein [Puniceicoccales bacterium]